jgi:hypothetical protein
MKLNRNILIVCIGLTGFFGFGNKSVAQTFSKNIIGYYNLRLFGGDNLIANQFVSQSDTLTNLFQYQVPDGSTFRKWDSTANQYMPAATYHLGIGWDINYGLGLGEGGLFHAPTEFTNVFAGIVWPGIDLNNPHNLPLVSIYGTLLLSCYIPFQANFNDVVGRDPQDGESVTTLDGVTQLYSTTTFNSGAWNNGAPLLAVGQSAFFNIAAVPEPSVLGLLGIGSAFMLLVNRATKR